MTTTCTIHTWHGTYRLSSGGRTDGASSSDSLFFLIASLRRRDPEALQGMAQAGPGLLSHSLPVFHHTRELPDSLLESIASDLQWRVASGQLSVEKIDLLKNLHVRDMPPPPPEIIEEPPEEVIAAAPVDEPAPPTTAWYEVVVTDENEMPIKNAKVIFTIGGQTYTVPTDSEGKARIEDVEEQEATAKIELPDDSASSAAADQNDAAAITEDAAAESDTPPVHCDFVEIPDILFHHGTAVPCLDSSGALLGALVTTLDFARSNPDKEVILFGHTDTSGDPSYNFDLSQWRAEGIKALLDNDVNTWLDVIDLASKVEDYQATLKALATAHGWPCDPGAVDNNSGPKTKTAVKAFQEQYNTRKSGSLKPDGVMGPKTWSALFAVMRDLLNAAWTAHTKEPALPALTYGHNGKGIYPCGESFPIEAADKDNYKSATNRRVEITFFDKGTAPELKAPADKKKVEKQEAPVYDGEKTERKVIPVKKAEPVLGDSIVLEFIFPQVNDASKPHKQYVNLDADG
ncbi:MAG: peptidoglycan-binding protein, partial [Chitinispirillaceae bacterium]|nr:peptidoglycan-binding protein [Chitinispirillaceae bacterium]